MLLYLYLFSFSIFIFILFILYFPHLLFISSFSSYLFLFFICYLVSFIFSIFLIFLRIKICHNPQFIKKKFIFLNWHPVYFQWILYFSIQLIKNERKTAVWKNKLRVTWKKIISIILEKLMITINKNWKIWRLEKMYKTLFYLYFISRNVKKNS